MPRLRLRPRKPSPPPAEIIGWRERVRLPKIGIGPIVAKIDTGARSAALHAKNIRVAGHTVHFRVPVGGRVHHCELRLAGRRHVKSSSGHREQ
ncbi:MAG: ATP-dependent zinc protease, partial [Alphaproteobacteria bacterium]|nr:ATP-dependent zinc protease [Alphaproteobacteria bacterium]